MRRFSISSASQDREAWLVLLLLVLGVLIPAASILWFTNTAAQHEASAARREAAEAYEGQLRLMRDRIDAQWQARAAELASAGSFPTIVGQQIADSAMVLREDGSLAYPIPFTLTQPEPSKAVDSTEFLEARTLEAAQNWSAAAELYSRVAESSKDPGTAARANQARIRCLLKLGDRETALTLMDRFFLHGPGFRAQDLNGRRIAADQFLLAIGLLPHSDRRRRVYLERLKQLLEDYEQNRMSSAQRLFLMTEAQRLGMAESPTYRAERLAAEFLEADQPRAAGAGLQATNLTDIWKLPSSDRRVVALYTTASVNEFSRAALVGVVPTGVRFFAAPPGSSAGDVTAPGGSMLPGWQLSFVIDDTRVVDAASARRRTMYLWTGYLAIAGLVATFLLLGRSFRRRLRLARLKTDLVAAVSHELKTPVASMRLLIDGLLENDGSEGMNSARAREYLALISSENLRLTRVIENFLTFARIEQRRLPFDFRETRPEDVVQVAVAAVRERFRQEASIAVECEPGLPGLRGDPDALATALINLVDNALKYSTDQKQVSVRAHADGSNIVFSVADSGIGIAPEQQKRIFRSFYQVDESLARETGGCGLGLSIVSYIVGAHGGSVAVTSSLGKGSTFSIALPSMRAT